MNSSDYRARWVALAVVAVTLVGCGGPGRGPEAAGDQAAESETAVAAPRGESPSDRADASPQQDPDDAPESAAPGAPSADAVTREGFLAIADRRCTESFAELDAVEYAEENTLEAAAPSFAEVVRINRELIQDLRALQPPPGEEGRVAGFLDGASRAIDALDVAVASAAGGDAAQFDQDLARFEQLTRQTYEQATAYGFTVCFQPPV